MDVSLLTTCLFAHKDVEMHSLYPIYPAHLSGQQEPGGQGWGAKAGVWGLLESTNTWSYVCSPETLAARFQSSLPPHIKEPCLFALNLGAASDCLHGETLEMLPSDCQGYMSLLLV